jgi:hypothetical protein
MRKLKSNGRDANSHGRCRYFYGDIRNRTRFWLIHVGAPMQKVPYARAKHHRRVTPIETHKPSPRASGAILLAPPKRSPPSSLSSFRLIRHGPRFLWYTMVAAPETRLMKSCKTLASLGTIKTARTSTEEFCGFSKLTQLTRNHLEQAQ